MIKSIKERRKIMRRFRKITVANSEYKWLFRFDDYDYQNLPYLLVIMCSRPASSLKIFFPIHEHFLLNSGLSAVLNGNAVLLNMNRPLFVSQIIEQCQKNGETFDHKGCRHLNGLKILEEIGYKIPDILRKD